VTLEESAPEPTPPSFSSAQLMVFGLDARTMAVGWSDGRIELWATQPFHRLSVIAESTNAPLHLVLSANGQRLSVHRADNTVEVWNPVAGTLELRFQESGPVHGGPNCEFWAQDRVLAVNVGQGIHLWFLPEGRRRVFPHPKVQASQVWFPAVSNDGRWLATSSWDGRLRLWEVEREQQVEIITGQRIIYYSLVFSPDDSRLVGGGYDGTITIWDMATRQQVAHWKAHDRECAWLRFVGPNQDLISAGNLNSLDRYQGEIRRWRAPSLAEINAEGGGSFTGPANNLHQ
jgi:WD40 repeat protein